MITLTKPQRVALKAVFDRQPIRDEPRFLESYYGIVRYLTYRQFRRTVRPGSGCIMVEWCHMWLGIEPDGHTHS